MGRFHLVVAGNIGVGKSSFVDRYARATGATPVIEPADANPYLADFYADRARWAFPSQVFFLVQRLHQATAVLRMDGAIVQDRSVYEDAEVFAENLFREGSLSPRDRATYRALYATVKAASPPPSVILYLRATVPTLERRIALRGREYEGAIARDYLVRLNELYDEFARGFSAAKVVTVDVDHLDFVRTPAHYDEIARAIEAARRS